MRRRQGVKTSILKTPIAGVLGQPVALNLVKERSA